MIKDRTDPIENLIAGYFNRILNKKAEDLNLVSGYFAHADNGKYYHIDRTILMLGQNGKPIPIGYSISGKFNDSEQTIEIWSKVPMADVEDHKLSINYQDNQVAEKINSFLDQSLGEFVEELAKIESEGLR